MLKVIKTFFEEKMTMNHCPDDPSHQLKLATAALLIEMIHQDEEVHAAEQQAVRNALRNNFELSDDETHALYQLAEQEIHQATDYYQFTRLIAEHYSRKDKIRVIELLWQVAYADNHLDAYEEHMVRRIADLIYVPHHEFIQAKLRAQQAML